MNQNFSISLPATGYSVQWWVNWQHHQRKHLWWGSHCNNLEFQLNISVVSRWMAIAEWWMVTGERRMVRGQQWMATRAEHCFYENACVMLKYRCICICEENTVCDFMLHLQLLFRIRRRIKKSIRVDSIRFNTNSSLFDANGGAASPCHCIDRHSAQQLWCDAEPTLTFQQPHSFVDCKWSWQFVDVFATFQLNSLRFGAASSI